MYDTSYYTAVNEGCVRRSILRTSYFVYDIYYTAVVIGNCAVLSTPLTPGMVFTTDRDLALCVYVISYVCYSMFHGGRGHTHLVRPANVLYSSSIIYYDMTYSTVTTHPPAVLQM